MALSADEQKRLLETLAAADGDEAGRDHAMFHLMLATGIRLGSAELSVTPDDRKPDEFSSPPPAPIRAFSSLSRP